MKAIIPSLLLSFGLVMGALQSPRPSGWRGILPLHSTRADVERLLGVGGNTSTCSYRLDAVNVIIN